MVLRRGPAGASLRALPSVADLLAAGALMLMPLHRCSSCSALVAGRCQHCRLRREMARPNASARGYTSDKWRRLRASKLQLDPHCSVCGQAATDVDHLIRHDGPQDPRFWDWKNFDSKCHGCHSRKTATQDSTFARRR